MASESPGTRRGGQNVAVVHDQLRKSILDGDIPPGEATSQVKLAKELGVSRTPLREALRLLEREGLVLSEPNRRIRVSDLSIADLEGLYSMRIAIEATGIRMTVPALRPEDFAELQGLIAQLDHFARTDDLDRFSVPHKAFHALLVSAVPQRMRTTVAQLFDHAERYRRGAGPGDPGGWKLRSAEHRAIVDAAAEGDGDLAAERLAAHYAHTALIVISHLDAAHDPSLLRTTIATVAPGAAATLWPKARSRAAGRR